MWSKSHFHPEIEVGWLQINYFQLKFGGWMKKLITILLFISGIVWGQNAWINEFHYDNSGTDTGEFIEVAIEDASSYNLSDFTITLYNGNGGASYGTHTLDTFTEGTTENNITLYYKNISGIQNGSPDGFSLDYQGTVIQFLSYEGTFTATNGPANGMTSTDVGVSESSSTPAGESLQLSGNGTQYSDFTWNSPAAETKGTPNNNQVLPVELTAFSASANGNNIELKWKTATEVNNYGFEIERAIDEKIWEKIGFVEGHGNSNSPKEYSFTDESIENSGKYFYRLKQIDVDGTFEYSPIVEVFVGAPGKFELAQNYPNPFNPATTISYSIPSDIKGDVTNVKLIVYDVLGREVATLVNEKQSPGNFNVTFNATHLPSGIYFYKLTAGNFTTIKKMILMK